MISFFKTAVLAYPFRPFFLLAGIYGALTIVAWMSYLFGGLALPLGWSSLHWHSHEMLFGFATAAISGFMLTAMCNWTGAPPLQAGGLLALVGLWLAGRIAMWTASYWPTGVVAIIDWLYLPVLGFYVLRVLLRYGNKRNLLLGVIILLLSLANLMMHTGFISGAVHWLQLGQVAAFNVITLIMLVIGGRIIPLFSANWLRNRGANAAVVTTSPRLDRIALISTALLIPAAFFTQQPWLTAALALVAALSNGLRLYGWSGWSTRAEPLLWILHVGYGWIVVSLLLKSAAAMQLVAPGVWQHALGVGAMGSLILGVMTRVALAHTGRALQLPDFALLIYLAISLAALARVLAALGWINYSGGVMFAASCWTLAFSLFVLIYWPILTQIRVDGRPG